jgi:hypothetical protein
VRDSVLYQALESFTTDAAAQLAYDTSRGVELPFELIETESRRGRPPLYCYRPLTGEFIERRVGVLSGLASYAPAIRALAAHERVGAYLSLHGVSPAPPDSRRQCDEALRLFLNRVFAERTEFEFDSARFTVAYQELEHTLLEGRCTTTVIVAVQGIGLDATTPEIQLGDGLALMPANRLSDPPPEVVWGEAEQPNVVAVLTTSGQRSGPRSPTVALERFVELLLALRLFERGTYALSPMAFSRIDSGPWRSVAVGHTGRSASLTLIPARHEDELRAFCSLIGRRRPRDGELAWALARYTMACQQADRFQALSDCLMALRALLEPEGPSSGRLAQRLAMICARPEDRARLAERAARAISLERAAIAGIAPPGPEAYELVEEMSEHLRALLRDVLCGHLDHDLVRVADGLLAAEAEAVSGAEGGFEAEVYYPKGEEGSEFEHDYAAAASSGSFVEPEAVDDPEPTPDPDPVGAPA